MAEPIETGADVEIDDLIPVAPAPSTVVRGNLIPFRPGQSGNPGGRGDAGKLAAPVRQKFRRAFGANPPDGCRSLSRLVLRMARGEDLIEAMAEAIRKANFSDPKSVAILSRELQACVVANRSIQLKAIEFVFREGFGKTPTSDEQAEKMAEKLLDAMIRRAEGEHAAAPIGQAEATE